MTPTHGDGSGQGPAAQFAVSRAVAQREWTDQCNRAVRTVAAQARDVTEFTGLLSMLGLDDGMDSVPVLSRTLADYVQRVATAVGIPADGIGYEVSDTATAYVGLADRVPQQPDRELMLLWDERLGWYLEVETRPHETPVVLCYLEGDPVPAPALVARFVTDVLAGRRTSRLRPVLLRVDRMALARSMAANCAQD